MIKFEADTPTYYVEEAVKFIHDRCKISEDTIREVLELEEDYMREIGLIIDNVEV